MVLLRAGRVLLKSATDRTINAQAARGLAVVFISGRVFALGRPTEIATVMIEVVHCANVFREEKVQCPIKCHTNLFVQAGQLAQVNCPPQPPGEEAREIETKNAGHARPTTDRSQQPDGLE
jgi:hypothetical protein